MSSSTVKIKLSDRVVEDFYSMFGGSANLSVTVNTLLTILLDEAERNESEALDDLIESIRERLA